MNFGQTSRNIDIRLYENTLLNSERNTCVGRIQPRGAVSISDLAHDVVERGSETHESILVSAVMQVLEAAFDRVKCGFSVDLEICHVRLGVQGVFDAAKSRFDSEKNNMSLICTPSARAVEALQCVHVQKVEKKISAPRITGVSPCLGDTDAPVKSGDLIQIHGRKIKIAGSSPDNGVWFVREQKNGCVRVKANDVIINNPSFIQAVVPPLDSGAWHVEIVTQFVHSSNTTKLPRICQYGCAISVENGKSATYRLTRVPFTGGVFTQRGHDAAIPPDEQHVAIPAAGQSAFDMEREEDGANSA